MLNIAGMKGGDLEVGVKITPFRGQKDPSRSPASTGNRLR